MKKQFRFTNKAQKLLNQKDSLHVNVILADAVGIILDLRTPNDIVDAIKIIEQSSEEYDVTIGLFKYLLEEFINLPKEELQELDIALEIKPLLEKLLKKIG